jgi:hypothetical protein
LVDLGLLWRLISLPGAIDVPGNAGWTHDEVGNADSQSFPTVLPRREIMPVDVEALHSVMVRWRAALRHGNNEISPTAA